MHFLFGFILKITISVSAATEKALKNNGQITSDQNRSQITPAQKANQLSADGWWSCASKDPAQCYGQFLRILTQTYKTSACDPNFCAKAIMPNYKNQIEEILIPAKGKDTKACKDGTCGWTHEMEYAANLAIQRAKKCDIDYTIIFSLNRSVVLMMDDKRKREKARSSKGNGRPTSGSGSRDLLSNLLTSLNLWDLSTKDNLNS